MHLCYFRIMKKLIGLWLKGSKCQYGSFGCVRLKMDQVDIINKKMKLIAPYIYSDFARVPKSLNDYHFFKSPEQTGFIVQWHIYP